MSPDNQVELIKIILDNLRYPERLDEHSWTKSPVVQAEIKEDPSLFHKGPGAQLIAALIRVFEESMPTTPPKRGKRLDTRWGKFGLLAARYFGPYLFGVPTPVSLRDAWGKIDQSLVLFVQKKFNGELSEVEISRYRLVGDELEIASNSTISDWHRKGIERLAEIWIEREEHLTRHVDPGFEDTQPVILETKVDEVIPIPVVPLITTKSIINPKSSSKISTRALVRLRNVLLWLLLICFLASGIFGVYKGRQIYQQVKKITAQVAQIQALASGKIDLDTIVQMGPLLYSLHEDIGLLRNATDRPLQLFGSWFKWLPEYGADISEASRIIEFADLSVNSARLSFLACEPIIKILKSKNGSFSPQVLANLAIKASPQLIEAKNDLSTALSLRKLIPTESLSPKTRIILEKLDKYLALMDEGLSGLVVLPKIIGASDEGPKTYMLLIQNEDELRATGGYLASIGSFVVRDGKLLGLKFENTDVYEDWTKPYPVAPWQVEKYMSIPVILLRDGNWSPDFPTSVSLIEYLYSYQNNHSVDGVIAIDQQALVLLLQAIGPINIEGVPVAISADNVTKFMREAKIPPDGANQAEWDRKAFIGNMADAIMKKLLGGGDVDWEYVARTMLGGLDQRHILLQFDDSEMTALVKRHSWSGAIQPGGGDFMMSIDTNIGYNKTNAVVEKNMTYDVDLTDMTVPKGSVVVFHKNNANAPEPCDQFGGELQPGDKWYAINRCYYNYLRIYMPAGTKLINASPHSVPAEWLMLGRPVPAKIDLLDEEIAGVQGFGTLLVVPGGQTLNTGFNFSLPANVISSQPGSSGKLYTLKLQKQPGTRAIPILIRIHLPTGSRNIQANLSAQISGSNILIETSLLTDILINVSFVAP